MPALTRDPDIGIVCDFLFEGGAEAVIETLAAAFPAARIYTAIHNPAEMRRYPALMRALEDGRLRSSFAQAVLRLPGVPGRLSLYHFYWLYFLTQAFQRTAPHDVVFVSSAAQSKLARIPRGARVVVYVHTPPRWLYPGLTSAADRAAIPAALRWLMRPINRALRPLDRLGIRRLARHDPVWICNSHYVQGRMREIYGIEAEVVFPPVDLQGFAGLRRTPEDFFLCHGRIAPQKRVDLAIEGCLLARRRLVISGQPASPELQRRLEAIVARAEARDPALRGLVSFLGRTTDAQLRDLLGRCAALVFPPREDFGIAPVEAMAAGVPVIAYRAGGALDYLQDGVGGVFFDAQEPASLAAALARFDPAAFDPAQVASALPDLSVARFLREMRRHAGIAEAAP